MMENKNMGQTEKGFTLVEMAIAMVIVSLLIAFATVAFSGALRRGFEKKTFTDMEIIADSIAVYTQKHMRVPCPADPTGGGVEPFGTERGSTAAGNVFGTCNTIANAEGIIPFATLGLPQRMARDRFGNYITYRVSLTSAQTPVNSTALPINSWCMTSPYWHADTDNNGSTDSYINLAKAAFCCGTWGPAGAAGVTGDVDIQGSFSAPLPNLSRRFDLTIERTAVGANAAEYRTSATAPPTLAELVNPGLGGGIDSTRPPNFPAYILISHGQNGLGAFGSQTGVRAGLAGMTVPEAENADNDVQFFASDRIAVNHPGAGNQTLFRPDIDDIVFWETPAQVLGRIGGVSCSSP